MSNVGDCLNEPLYEWITGVGWTKEKGISVLAAGTILRNANKGRQVWGAGYDGFRDMRGNSCGKIHAVRGPLTRKACLSFGWDCPEVYGDPGILVDRLYPPKVTNKEFDVGWIPHFKDDLFDKSINGWHFISARTSDVEAFLNNMQKCRVIASQSLHGLIFADVLGIPSIWYPLSNSPSFDNIIFDSMSRSDSWIFKYLDYFASIGAERKPSKNPDDAESFVIPEEMKDKLLKVCPWKS